MNTNKRRIAIFTDAHALLEPTKAALEDISRRGINEIYSLGDNIGVGPNPGEVIDLLEEYNVMSLAGNSEEYIRLGIEPFSSYFNMDKMDSYFWTLSMLNEHQKELIRHYPHSQELLLGGKKIALCHFANDVRFDYTDHSTFSYQKSIFNGKNGYEQFLYTNSLEQIEDVKRIIKNSIQNDPTKYGYLSALEDPLFAGKKVDYFNALIEGHVHWKIFEASNTTNFYTIRALGMAYQNDPIDTASYVILTETDQGYDLEEVLVKFDREQMEYHILNSTSPDTQIYKFTELTRRL